VLEYLVAVGAVSVGWSAYVVSLLDQLGVHIPIGLSHAPLDQAPLVNGALGITIRGAGLTRPRGGMYGFWRRFVAHYRALGGVLRVGCPVLRVERRSTSMATTV